MSLPFGGLQVLANVTGITVSAAGAIYTTGWTVLGPTTHGGLDAVPAAAGGTITLTEGNWLIKFNASVQQNGTSGVSTAGVTEEITLQAYLDAVALSGALAIITNNELDVIQTVGFETVINVAHGAAGVLTLHTSTTQVGGSDLTIRNANFTAIKL